MKTVKEYDVTNRNGVIVCQVHARSPKEAQKYANKMDTGLVVSKKGRKIRKYACQHYGEHGTPDRVCPNCYIDQQMAGERGRL